MPKRSPSRRILLGALAKTPASFIPLTHASPSEWEAAVNAWQDAETTIAPAHARFDAAERHWFAVRGDTADDPASLAWIEMERVRRDHDRALDLHEEALHALLRTRAPDVPAIVWKLGLIRAMLGADWPELLNFLPTDLHALQGDPHDL